MDGPSRFRSAARKLGVAFLAIGAYMFVSGIDKMLGTHDPSVTTTAQGTLLFQIGPRYIPACGPILASALVVIVGTGFFRKKNREKDSRGRSTRVISAVLLTLVLLVIGAIFVAVVAADFRAYRCVEVSDDTVELRALFSATRISRSNIQRAKVHREHTTHRGRPTEILSFEIEDSAGTVRRSWYAGSRTAGLEEVLTRLERELATPLSLE